MNPDKTRTSLVAFALYSALLTAPGFAQEKSPIPPAEAGAKGALEKSPRHGEFVDVQVPGMKVPLKTFVAYPERKDNAPVVIVIHEIFGLTDWVRSVADQLAADGFIAIAPDLLSGRGPDGGGTESIPGEKVRDLVRGLKPDEVVARLNAVRDYGMKLPASNKKTACIGFCWGGAMSFHYATAQPGLGAAVVYYGASPEEEGAYKGIKAPVLGIYASDDQRVNGTIPRARENMSKQKKSYDVRIYEGAGHGFLRAQDGREANAKGAREAWPETVKFLRENTK